MGLALDGWGWEHWIRMGMEFGFDLSVHSQGLYVCVYLYLYVKVRCIVRDKSIVCTLIYFCQLVQS